MTSFRYFDLLTCWPVSGELPNANIQQEFIDERLRHRHREPTKFSPAESPFWTVCSTNLARLSQDASLLARPMKGRMQALVGVAAHTSTVSRARIWLSQQRSHVSGPAFSILY